LTSAERDAAGKAPRHISLRWLLALCALLAAAATAARYTQDLRLRREAERFVRAEGLADRYPGEGRAISLEPAGDLAAGLAVSAAVSKPVAPARPLPVARQLMLEAVSCRPGWAYHRYLLALSDGAPGARSRRILQLAADAAPGLDVIWSRLGKAVLAGDRSPEALADAREILRRALLDEEFVSSEFSEIARSLGLSHAVNLLPEDAAVLQAAAANLAERDELPGAALVLERAEKAERREREDELRDLERRRGLNDVEGLRRGCIAWFDNHPHSQLDDAAGRHQLARLLALWPDDRLGSWGRDRRARLVRFFLEGRARDVQGKTLARTIDSLVGVPGAVRAHVDLLAGRPSPALDPGAVARDSLEWDPYFLELGRRDLAAGRVSEARGEIERLSLGAREGCEGLLLRRAVALSVGDPELAADAERRLAQLRDPPETDWASKGELSLCVDPVWSRGRRLDVEVGPGSPAILSWGWDAGRAGTVLVPGEAASFRVPLDSLTGRRTLWVSFLAGGTQRTLHAFLRETS
jgi:hypothetical protein